MATNLGPEYQFSIQFKRKQFLLTLEKTEDDGKTVTVMQMWRVKNVVADMRTVEAIFDLWIDRYIEEEKGG
jgi:hypothetical protein